MMFICIVLVAISLIAGSALIANAVSRVPGPSTLKKYVRIFFIKLWLGILLLMTALIGPIILIVNKLYQ